MSGSTWSIDSFIVPRCLCRFHFRGILFSLTNTLGTKRICMKMLIVVKWWSNRFPEISITHTRVRSSPPLPAHVHVVFGCVSDIQWAELTRVDIFWFPFGQLGPSWAAPRAQWQITRGAWVGNGVPNCSSSYSNTPGPRDHRHAPSVVELATRRDSRVA